MGGLALCPHHAGRRFASPLASLNLRVRPSASSDSSKGSSKPEGWKMKAKMVAGSKGDAETPGKKTETVLVRTEAVAKGSEEGLKLSEKDSKISEKDLKRLEKDSKRLGKDSKRLEKDLKKRSRSSLVPGRGQSLSSESSDQDSPLPEETGEAAPLLSSNEEKDQQKPPKDRTKLAKDTPPKSVKENDKENAASLTDDDSSQQQIVAGNKVLPGDTGGVSCLFVFIITFNL